MPGRHLGLGKGRPKPMVGGVTPQGQGQNVPKGTCLYSLSGHRRPEAVKPLFQSQEAIWAGMGCQWN